VGNMEEGRDSTQAVIPEVLEVGTAPVKVEARDKTGGVILTVEKDTNKTRVLHLRNNEIRLLESIVNHGGDLRAAGRECGMNNSQILAFLKRPSVRLWVKARIKEAAVRNGVTLDWWISRLKEVADGSDSMTTSQADAMKLLGKFLGIDRNSMVGDAVKNLPKGKFELNFSIKKE
jgi:hypothetical protein